MFSSVIKFCGVAVAVVGFMMIAGSAGDCDGKCMEQANTIGEMMTAIAIGMAMLVGGVIVASKA